jgi:hypothetical protein
MDDFTAATAAGETDLAWLRAANGSLCAAAAVEPIFNTFMPAPDFLKLRPLGRTSLSFELVDRATNGRRLGYSQFMSAGVGYDGNIMLDTHHQGYGYGRRCCGGILLGLQHLGCHTFKVYAALSTGGYAWARFGIPYDVDDDNAEERPLLRKEISQRLTLLEQYAPQLPWAQLQDSVALDDPYCMRRIADFRPDIDMRALLAEGLFDNDGEIGFIPDDDALLVGRAGLLQAWEHAGPGRIAPGFLVLAGTTWPGKLYLDDRDPDFRGALDYAASAPPLPSELEINERLIALRNQAEAKLG